MLLLSLGLRDVLDDPRIAGDSNQVVLPENINWVRARVEDRFSTRPRDEWIAELTSVGVPCGPLHSAQEWLDHEQMRAIGMRLEIDDSDLGAVVMPGMPINLVDTPAVVRTISPQLGEHGGRVIPRDPKGKPTGRPPLRLGPLDGFKTLGIGTFVATPYAGMLLATLGAQVVKVEPPQGDPFRTSGFMYNRGVQSIAIDLKAEEGLRAFYGLASTADVIIDGLRPGVTTRLGIDYDSMVKLKPDIISLSLSAYGEGGPMSHLPGFDMVIQGVSGQMSFQGGADEPVANTIAINDMMSAVGLTLGATLALLHRVRSGLGQRAWASIAGFASLLQCGEIVAYRGSPRAAPGSADHKGSGIFDRYYRTADHWVRLARPSSDYAVDIERSGLAIDVEAFVTDGASELQRVLGTMAANDVVASLRPVGVSCAISRSITEVIRDPVLIAAESFHFRHAPNRRVYVLPGRLSCFSRTPKFGDPRTPGLGEHSTSVLRQAGFDKEAIKAILHHGAVIEGDQFLDSALPVAYR